MFKSFSIALLIAAASAWNEQAAGYARNSAPRGYSKNYENPYGRPQAHEVRDYQLVGVRQPYDAMATAVTI